MTRAMVVFALVAAMPVAAARAQTIEVAAGTAFVLSQKSFAYTTRYEPRIEFLLESTGTAGQTLSLEPGRDLPLWGSIALFPAAHAGIEARVWYRRAGLDGSSTPHELVLVYESRQPPNFIPSHHRLEQQDPQPDPDGTLRELSVDLMAAGRFGDPRRLQCRIAAGVSISRISGDVRPVAFSAFRLGGHAVVFAETYAVDLEIEPDTAIAFVASAEIHRALSPHVGLVAGARLSVAPDRELAVRVRDVSTALGSLTAADVQERLRPSPLTLPTRTVDLLAGIRLAF